MPDLNYITEAAPPDPVPGQPGHFDHHTWLKAAAVILDATIKTKNDERVAAHNTLANAFEVLSGNIDIGEGSSIVGTIDAQVITNKTINGENNTLTNIPGIEVDDLPASNVKKDAWTTYTPTLGGGWSGGSPTITGAYQRIGNTINCWGKITTLASMTLTTSPTFTLPFPVHASRSAEGHAVLTDNGTARYAGAAVAPADATVVTISSLGTAGILTNLTTTVPFTWVTADSINWSLTYETDAA